MSLPKKKKSFSFAFLCLLALAGAFVPLLRSGGYKTNQNEKIFSKIYKHSCWGVNKKGKANSGPGSTAKATETYRQFLTNFMKEHQIKSVVDVGCGDWEFSSLIDWTGIQYIGYEVVRPLIKRNQQDYGNKHIKFKYGDLEKTNFPKADLLICKDVLMHLNNQSIQHFLKTQTSKFKYCLLTNDVNSNTFSSDNEDIKNGNFRPLDLTKAPFFLENRIVLLYPAHSSDQSERGVIKQVVLIDNTSSN